jgi:hypothetical protein
MSFLHHVGELLGTVPPLIKMLGAALGGAFAAIFVHRAVWRGQANKE